MSICLVSTSPGRTASVTHFPRGFIMPDKLTCYSTSRIAPTRVNWLWKPYLARGKLCILDGDPGTGKSFLAIDLAARLSRGGPLPDGQTLDRPHNTVLISAEDHAGDTIRPRL